MPESVLVGLGTTGQLRRAGDARLRRGLGRSGVENAGRADRQCLFALLVGGLESAAHDGTQQYRAHYRSSLGLESARNQRGEEALSPARGDRLTDGGIETRGLAPDRAAVRRR